MRRNEEGSKSAVHLFQNGIMIFQMEYSHWNNDIPEGMTCKREASYVWNGQAQEGIKDSCQT